MIVLNLKCESNHQFEAWFKNKNEFTRQTDDKMVTCPMCSSPVVNNTKSIGSTPSYNHLQSFVSNQEIKMISEQFIDKEKLN